MSTTESLYDRAGGAPAIDAAVDLFYKKVLADARISHFFVDVNMSRQRAMLRTFLTMAFGGPARYSGKSLRDGHSHLVGRGLNDTHFDAVMGHLGATLIELGVAPSAIQEMATVAESTRGDVLGR